MEMENTIKKTVIPKHIFSGLLIAVIFWFFDSIIHHFIYGERDFEYIPSDFNELWMRITICVLVIILGVYIHFATRRLLYSLNDYKGIVLELNEANRLLAEKSLKLEKLSQYKTQFLANMSHELRTPLNSLMLLCNILLKNKYCNLNEKQLDNLRIINDSGNELLSLIVELLDLSKIESGKVNLNYSTVSLKEVVRNLKDMFEHMVKRKDLFLHIDISEQLPAEFYSDLNRLQQILKNFISNAIKYTVKGGITLTISGPENDGFQQDRKMEDQQTIVFSVTDTGIGIPFNKQEEIFNSYSQLNDNTDNEYGSAGLGLFISRKLAALLGGEIKVESRAGTGSTFFLILPLRQPVFVKSNNNLVSDTTVKELQHGYPVNATVSGNTEIDSDFLIGKTVLLVDDDVRTLYALEEELRNVRMNIIKAVDGKQALDKINDRPDIDIVLLDIMIPIINGLDVIREVRMHERFSHLPVIAITAKAFIDDRNDCLSAGANGYMAKPLDINALLSLIEQCLKKKS